jgi:PAS domain S-box-containing protein
MSGTNPNGEMPDSATTPSDHPHDTNIHSKETLEIFLNPSSDGGEANLLAIVNQLPDTALFNLSIDNGAWKFDYISASITQITGVSDTDIIGNFNVFLQECIHPKDMPQFLASVHRAAAAKSEWSYEGRFMKREPESDPTHVVAPSLQSGWWRITAVPSIIAEQGVTFSGVINNITDVKRNEEQVRERSHEIETVALVGAEIAQHLSEHDLLWSLVNLTRDSFDHYHVQVYLYESSTERLILAAGSTNIGLDLVTKGHSIPISTSRSLVARAARNQQIVIANDVQTEPDFLPNPLLPDTRSEIVIPLIVIDDLIGVLDIQDNTIDTFSEIKIQGRALLANQIAVAINNARTFSEAVRARQEVDRIFKASADMIASATLDGYLLTFNPVWEKLLGYNRNELGFAPLYDFVHPDDTERVYEAVTKVKARNTTDEFEARLITVRGDVLWALWQLSYDHDASQLYLTVRDVTEKRQAEEELILRRVALEASNASVAIADMRRPDQPLIYVNDAFVKITGYSAEEAIGKNCRYLQRDDRDQPGLNLIRNALKNGTTTSTILRNYRKDGQLFYNEINLSPVKDDDGIVTHYIAIANDITARMINDQERDRLVSIINTSRDFIAIMDFDGRLVYVNPSGIDLIGYASTDELLDQSFAILQTPDDFTTLKRFGFSSALAEGEWRGENRILRRDGSILPVEQTVFVVRNPNGTPKELATIISDISVRKDIERQIELSQLRAELVASISTALTQASDEESILGAVAAMGEVYGANASILAYVEQEDTERIRFRIAGVRNDEEAASSDLLTLSAIVTPENYPLLVHILQHPEENLVIEDMMADRPVSSAAQIQLQAVRIQATILIPLFGNGRWQGFMMLNWKEAQTFPVELIEVMESIRAPLSATVASRRAYLAEEESRALSDERADELATVAQVSTQVASSLDVDGLLQQVADLVKQRFGLYHAHIYLLNESEDLLVLAAGAGEPGRLMKQQGHAIPYYSEVSIVAQTARSHEGRIVNDVTSSSTFLPNPLLPATKSEMSVPMLVRGQLIGVLDVQSDEISHFTEDDLRVKSILASQVGIALQNARAFTELEQRAQEERRTAEQLRELDRLKSQFLANMSHELRTPLNSIIGYAEVLMDGVDGELSDDAVEDVTAIYDSGRHLLSIINEVLDLAKIEAGQMQLDRREMSLPELVQEVVRSGQILVKDKDVQLTLSEDSAVTKIVADQLRLKQIIWNLVSNAVKFTEHGSVTVQYGSLDSENVYVKVVDTGIGIGEEKQQLIFERFSQVDGSSTRRAGGTGLGLTITQQLVRMHGGDIRVESKLGEGSIFTLTLPVQHPEDQPA